MADKICKRTGKYKVTFKWPDAPGGAFLTLQTIHEDSPILDTKKPYSGLLCEHELDFLKSLPGRNFSEQWSFIVKRIS